MTERKAKKLFAEYMQAELNGQNSAAETLENQLNQAGWFIVTGQDGLTVEKRQESGGLTGTLKDPFSNTPKESDVQPYSSTEDENSGSNFWLIAGISMGALALIGLVIYLIKRFKKNG